MKRLPIYSEPIRWFAKQLMEAQTPDDVIDSWLRVSEQFWGYNAICVLPNFETDKYVDDVLRQLSIESNFIAPYFYLSKLYFIDNAKIHQMMSKHTEVRSRIDFSITMDSNFASYIDRFINEVDLDTVSKDVEDIIDILLRNDYHYDYGFYLIENLKQINGDILDTSIILENEKDIERTLFSLELFKSIDTAKYRKVNEIYYSITKRRAARNAREILSQFYHRREGREYLNYYYDFHKQIYLVLLIMVKVDFSSRRSQTKKFHEFFDECMKKIGVFMDREFRIVWEYFNPHNRLRIFRKVQRGIKLEKLLKELENIAWDLLAPRVIEANIPTRGSGDFYIPYFLTMDKGLLEILKLYSVKGVIYGDTMSDFTVLPTVSADDFMRDTGIVNLEERFLLSKEDRMVLYNSLWETIDDVISSIEDEIEMLVRINTSQ